MYTYAGRARMSGRRSEFDAAITEFAPAKLNRAGGVWLTGGTQGPKGSIW